MSTYVQDNITFSNVKNNGITYGSFPVGKSTHGVGQYGGIINGVDIDWNSAELTLPAAFGGTQQIVRTGQLLSIIQAMANAITPGPTPTSYTITKTSNGADKVDLNKVSASAGETITLTLHNGYDYNDFSIMTYPSTTVTWGGSSWSFEMPASNVSVEVDYYDPNPHNITKTGTGASYVSLSANTATGGTTIYVTPAQGYDYTNLRVSGMGAEDMTWNGSAWQFTMPYYDITINVELIVTYSITKTGNGASYVSVQANAEQGVSVFITPENGYDHNNFTITGSPSVEVVWNGEAWHFYMPGENLTLDIVYGATTTYTLSTAGTGANFIDLSALSAAANEQITVTPKTSYSYAYFTISTTPTSQVYGTGSYWTFAMPASNTTVNADYNP